MRSANFQHRTQKLTKANSVKRSITQAQRSVSDSTVHRRMEERKDRMPPRNQLIACVIRQHGTGLYRPWVSLNKDNTACLGAHQDESLPWTINALDCRRDH